MEEKQKNRTEEDEKILADRFMLLFKEAGEIKNSAPTSAEAQNLVKRIFVANAIEIYCDNAES